jgi:hypothetical protein
MHVGLHWQVLSTHVRPGRDGAWQLAVHEPPQPGESYQQQHQQQQEQQQQQHMHL